MTNTLLILAATLPLVSAVLTAALGPRVLRGASHLPTIAALIGAFACSVLLLREVIAQSQATGADSNGWETVVNLWSWARVERADQARPGNEFRIDVCLRADTLTAIMLTMVTFVAALIAIYSAGYMHGDRGYWRFFSYLSLFVFSMAMLVSVSNFVLLYVFWEAVGVCSYLLIGFWYEKPAAAAAAKKAFLVNRVGDVGFALGVFLIWTTYGTLNFHDTFADGAPRMVGGDAGRAKSLVHPGVLGRTRLSKDDFVGGKWDNGAAASAVALAICIALLAGACGKSAQFPLHVWLPDAMEGPTPVSALIHAATMVTAGVYMIARCSPLFLVSPEAQMAVASIGGFTALLAGLIAVTQTDLKRILAYSTISQLGYMFLALGTGSRLGIVAGMFHLFTHAFFKALLFLGAGSVMHAMGGVIDVRRLGGLRRKLPITHWTFLVGCLALSGVPPLAGFWSKDAILHAVHERAHEQPLFQVLFYAALVTAWLTALYTFRAFFLTFYGPERIPAEAGEHAHESPPAMTLPLAMLAVCAVVAGLAYDSFASHLAWTPSLAFAGARATGAVAAPLDPLVATLSTVVALAGVGLAAFLYLGRGRDTAGAARLLEPLLVLSRRKFFLDEIYNAIVVRPLAMLADLAYWIDRVVIDGIVDVCGAIPAALGVLFRSLQTGLVQYYLLWMVMGVILLLLIGARGW